MKKAVGRVSLIQVAYEKVVYLVHVGHIKLCIFLVISSHLL